MCKMCLCIFILFSLAISLSSGSLSGNGVSNCGHRNGSSEEINCPTGTGCVLTKQICDGFPDCPDGSDELLCPFNAEDDVQSNIRGNRSRRQVSCRSDQWQCKNGDCILRNKLCDQVSDCSDNSDEATPICRKRAIVDSGACILPPHPVHGRYDVEDIPDARPGRAHPSFVLTVRCRRGYGVVDLNGDGSGIQKVYCVNGKWYQNMPKCERFCKLDPDPSIRYMCYTPGTGRELCRHYVSPGTLVEASCNTPVYYSSEVSRNMKCISGVWNHFPQCKVECGTITPGGKPLLIGGKEAKHGELPWHAAVYRRVPEVFMQICSGSLVSNNVVISAAHCFWKDLSKLLPASQFGIAVGKLHRAWDSEEDVYVQKSLVKEIKIEKLYSGVAANFQEDIAILILSTPINYTTYIRPVCLDFNMYIESLQLKHGVLGKVAGWGLISPNGPPSETLKVLSLPFINEDICVETLPESFKGYLTGDKFCAGYTNGTAVCHGDSGGGLAFASVEFFRERYYLRGIVSTAPKDDNKICNDNAYTTFTKVSKHRELIIDALAESEKKICPLYSFQCADGSCVDPGADCNGRRDCADGSDESDDLCRVGPPPQSLKPSQNTINTDCGTIAKEVQGRPISLIGNSYLKGETPWLISIYETIGGSLTYLCSGNLISKSHVLTVAHTFLSEDIESLIRNIVVKLGSSNLEDWTEDSAITRKLASINLIDSFNATLLDSDLSILTLNRQVEFTTYIRPICLWDGKKIPDSSGVFAGWGQERALKFGKPHILRLNTVSTAVCRASNDAFQHVTSDKTFCAKSVKDGTNPCAGDAGGGFYQIDGGRWYLRGVVFVALPSRSENELCNLDDYAVFTEVSQHLSWIKSIISGNR